MEVFILLCLCLSHVYAIKLEKIAYLKLPYDISQGVEQFGMFQKAAHKAAYHATDRVLYVASGNSQKFLHIVDMVNPVTPRILQSYQFSDNQDGLITDIDVCGDMIAVSLANVDGVVEGHVELFNAYNRFDPFVPLHRISVGVHPKSLKFIFDCSRIIVANEGIPARDTNGNFRDPEAEVTIILLNSGGNPLTVPIDFLSINNRVKELTDKGVRYVYLGDHLNGITNTFSQDLEPEAVAVSSDGQYAYVSLQENNAIVKINLYTYQIQDIYPVKPKTWRTFNIDASDGNQAAKFETYAVYGLKQPGSLAYTEINGNGYIITADTGKMKTITSNNAGVDFSDGERCRSNAANSLFDQPCMDANVLTASQNDGSLGRAFMSVRDGFNSRSLIKDIYLFGGRGISILRATNLTEIYDSGDDFEVRAEQAYPMTFNGDCSDPNKTPRQEVDKLSPETGPTPTVVKVADVNNTKLLFSGTRTGLIYLFTLSETAASFQAVYRDGKDDQTWLQLYNSNDAGDAIITDLGYIAGSDSGTGDPLVYVVGEASGTVGLYKLSDVL